MRVRVRVGHLVTPLVLIVEVGATHLVRGRGRGRGRVRVRVRARVGSTVTLRPGWCTPSAEAAAPPMERPCTRICSLAVRCVWLRNLRPASASRYRLSSDGHQRPSAARGWPG